MATYPVEIQDDETACGVYCVKMILKYYGIDEDASIIKEKCRVDAQGTSVKGLVEALAGYAIEAKAYHCPLDDFRKIKMPCILHLEKDGYGHFVVLYEMKDDDYLIGDPSCGLRHFTKAKLAALYSENLITVTHLGRYYHYQSRLLHSFLSSQHKRYRHDLRVFNRISFAMSLMSLLSAMLYALLIDHVRVNSPMLLVALILGAYGLMALLKVLLALLKEKKASKLHSLFDQDYVCDSLKQVMHYDESFFARGEGKIVNSLLDFYSLSDLSLDYFQVIDHDSITLAIFIIGLSLISLPITCIVIACLLIMGLIVRYQSESLVLVYKQMKHDDGVQSEKLVSMIRSRFNRYLFGETYFQSYEEAFTKAQESQLAYEDQKRKLQRTCLLFEAFLNIIVLGLGLLFYHLQMLKMGEVFMVIMITFQLFDPTMTIMRLMVFYGEEKMVFEHFKEFHLPISPLADHLEKVSSLTVHNLSYSYGYHEDVLSHLDFTIAHSCFLSGDNGAGKSTLLRLLAGSDHYYRGQILYNDQELRNLSTAAIASHVLYIGDRQLFNGTVFENFLCEDMSKIASVLKEMQALDLTESFDLHIDETGAPLSKGQAALILIARALLSKAEICLLDETLDALTIKRAQRLVKVLMNSEKIFVIVTHHEALKAGYESLDLLVQKDA